MRPQEGDAAFGWLWQARSPRCTLAIQTPRLTAHIVHRCSSQIASVIPLVRTRHRPVKHTRIVPYDKVTRVSPLDLERVPALLFNDVMELIKWSMLTWACPRAPEEPVISPDQSQHPFHRHDAHALQCIGFFRCEGSWVCTRRCRPKRCCIGSNYGDDQHCLGVSG